jgi:hypothetical protein
VSDPVDLMNLEAIARLRHGLRTPLNHLIGYAGMVRDEALEQSAKAEAALMEEVLAVARQMVEVLTQFLPPGSHIAGDAVRALRDRFQPFAERIPALLAAFEEMPGNARSQSIRDMRGAARELIEFSRGGSPAPASWDSSENPTPPPPSSAS